MRNEEDGGVHFSPLQGNGMLHQSPRNNDNYHLSIQLSEGAEHHQSTLGGESWLTPLCLEDI